MSIPKQFLFITLILFFLSTTASARAVWVEGTVTAIPYTINDNYYIHVDGNLYKILANARITYRSYRDGDAFNEEPTSLDAISMHHKILLKADHNNVSKVILY